MSGLPAIVFLLCNIIWLLICGIKATDLTFEELNQLNITCNDESAALTYSCQQRRMERSEMVTTRESCHCDSSCSQLGTCCLDSSFQDWNQKSGFGSCRNVQNKFKNFYFLIDKCPNTENTNDAFQSLCENEQNAKDDFMTRLPVTSLSTNLSYKNYFCFRCHESNDDYVFWNVELMAPVEFKSRRYEDVNVTYNNASGEWFASDGGNDTMHPVSVSIEIPQEVQEFPKRCSKYLISDCSVDWPQDEIRRKCSMYMFPVGVIRNSSYLLYKNLHCALCNSEIAKTYNCVGFYRVDDSFGTSKKLYSFTLLMDIVKKDGEKVGKTQRCDDNSAWDPFFKKCRELLCVLPGYTIKDGKCKPA